MSIGATQAAAATFAPPAAAERPAQALLEVRGLTAQYGPTKVLHGIDFAVGAGGITAVLGANGAGKTTTFNVITRLYDLDAGDVLLDGKSLLRTPASRVIRHGITRTFQNVELFRTMTVLDNVLVGAYTREKPFRSGSIRAQAQQALEYVEIADLAARPASGLPFGTLKRVELARALVAEPKLLLLDEPAGGLNHEEVGTLMELLRRIRAELGLTMLLVEHHMNMVMRISDRVVALDFGRKIADGTPAEVQANEDVVRAYLGVAA